MEEKGFCDYLYEQCLEIEPRDAKQYAKFVSSAICVYLCDRLPYIISL